MRETNEKEDNEIALHYLQWTGNEEELTKLITVIQNATYGTIDGDVARFEISSVRIPEAAVDAHMACVNDFGKHYNRHTFFHKHVGVFRCPEFVGGPHGYEGELDSHFYYERIAEYFTK